MRKIRPKRQGVIKLNSVKLEPHELATILFYTHQGKDVEIIPTSHTPGNRSPDFVIDGIIWEAKSPIRNIRRTIERAFYNASSQSKTYTNYYKGSGAKILSKIATFSP